jgi:hypothetical protein
MVVVTTIVEEEGDMEAVVVGVAMAVVSRAFTRLQIADTDIQRDRGTLVEKRARRIHSLVQDPHVLASRPSGQSAAFHRLFTPIVDYTLPVERHMISPSTLCRPHYSFNRGYSEMLAGNTMPGKWPALPTHKISMDNDFWHRHAFEMHVPFDVPVL